MSFFLAYKNKTLQYLLIVKFSSDLFYHIEYI